MKTKHALKAFCLCLPLALWLPAIAQTTVINYQGQLDVGGNPANGNYDMTFTLYVGPTGGTPLAGPITVNPVAVNNGFFTVFLSVSPAAFNFGVLAAHFVEIAVRPTGNTAPYTVLTPRQPLAQTPYAVAAQTAATADSVVANAVTAAGIAPGQVVKSLNGLEDAITLVAGSNVTITASVNTLIIDSTAGDGGNSWSLTGNAGTSPGTNFLGTTDNRPLQLRAGNATGLTLEYAGHIGASLDSAMNVVGGYWGNATLNGAFGATISGGGYFESSSFGSSSYSNTVVGDLGTVSGGAANMAGLFATVPGGYANSATGLGSLAGGYYANATHAHSFVWSDGSQPSGFNSTGPNTFNVLATGGVLLDTEFAVVNGLGGVKCYLGDDGVNNDVQVGSLTHNVTAVSLYNPTDGAPMHLFCSSITILGGADLAEPFQITPSDAEEIPEGSVVVIDERNPGRLRISDRPYDTRVAGVVSGANGLNPGIQMRQQRLLESGRNVALTGRVYVEADASNGPIKPGDLLTTSTLPGHAMRVSDHARAQGAVLGKAMTGLANGQGTVLVLVTLQ